MGSKIDHARVRLSFSFHNITISCLSQNGLFHWGLWNPFLCANKALTCRAIGTLVVCNYHEFISTYLAYVLLESWLLVIVEVYLLLRWLSTFDILKVDLVILQSIQAMKVYLVHLHSFGSYKMLLILKIRQGLYICLFIIIFHDLFALLSLICKHWVLLLYWILFSCFRCLFSFLLICLFLLPMIFDARLECISLGRSTCEELILVHDVRRLNQLLQK